MKPSPDSPLRVAIACGGTGGHLFPGLAVGEQLRQAGCRVTLLISPKEVDQKAVQGAAGFEIATLPAVGLTRRGRLAFVLGFTRSYFAAARLFKPARPAAVLAMGGFTSAPPILAGRMSGAATFLHESNTIPGRANRWLARVVDGAYVGFPEAAARLSARAVTMTGTPVRPEFISRPAAECRAALGLDPEKPVLLVAGGSQGARGVNDLLLAALPLLRRLVPELQYFHLTGPADCARVEAAYAAAGSRAVVRPFFAEMHLALGAATAAVSRAGASAMAELAALRLPAVLVPFPAAVDDHQWHNAEAFARSGAAVCLRESEIKIEFLVARILELIESAESRARMMSALEGWQSPGAARHIAEDLLEVVAGRRRVPGAAPLPPPMKLKHHQSAAP